MKGARLLPTDQYNIGYICTTWQCQQGRGDKTAMRWISAHGDREEWTFSQLDQSSNRAANALLQLGLAPGDLLFTFLPKLPEHFTVF